MSHICLTPRVASRNLCVSEPQFTLAMNGHHFVSTLILNGSLPMPPSFITETPNQNYFSVPESIYLNNVGWFSSYYSP